MPSTAKVSSCDLLVLEHGRRGHCASRAVDCCAGALPDDLGGELHVSRDVGLPVVVLVDGAEVAAAVLWLCSPGASLIVGVALPVDGGFVAH